MNKCITFLFVILTINLAYTQEFTSLLSPLKTNTNRSGLKIKQQKMGPYVGINQGKFMNLELGAERQWKRIKLIKPRVHTWHTGFDYNFKQRVLGYSLGYWYKQGRINLTYGGSIVYRTNFTENRFGIAPAVGFKLFGFHLQTGYNFYTRAANFDNLNTFFISLRFTIVNSRDFDIITKKNKDGFFNSRRKNK